MMVSYETDKIMMMMVNDEMVDHEIINKTDKMVN